MLRIAFITYEYPPDTAKGGIATYTYQIANLLAASGLIIHVFASSSKRDKTEKQGNTFIHWVLSSNHLEFRNQVLYRFNKIHAKVNFEIIESAEIHGNAWKVKQAYPDIPLIVRLHASNFLVEKLKKKYVPLAVKLRYLIGTFKRGKIDLGYWRIYNKGIDPDYHFTLLASKITAPSSSMKEWVCTYWKINASKIQVIPNPFIPVPSLASIPISMKYEYKTIIFLGRLNVLKGLFNATKAVKDILLKYPDWEFRVIGDDGPGPNPIDGTMKKWMMNELSEVSNRVHFFNGINYNELPTYLKDCEILLIPSLFESFSYVCIEGMLAGKAVIGSIEGGMRDLIEHRKSGLLVNPYSKKQIMKALEELITNPMMCYQLRLNAREKVTNNYNNKIIVQQYIEMYNYLLSR